LRIAPFSSTVGEWFAPLSAFIGAFGTPQVETIESESIHFFLLIFIIIFYFWFRKNPLNWFVTASRRSLRWSSRLKPLALLRSNGPCKHNTQISWKFSLTTFSNRSAFESDLRALRKAAKKSRGPLVFDLPPSAIPFVSAVEVLRALPNKQCSPDAVLSTNVLASLAHITQLTAASVVLASGGESASADVVDASESSVASTSAAAAAPAAIDDAEKLKRAIADATEQKKRSKYVGISYLDSQHQANAVETAQPIPQVPVGTAAALQRRNEVESSRAMKQAQRLLAVGTTTGNDSVPLRYEPHAHVILAWSAMAVDGDDNVHRALVRSGVFTHLATFLNDAQSSRESRDLAMSCARRFFKFPRWQELMIADGLLSAFAHVLATEHDNEQAQVKCLELLACFDMRHQATLIDCGVVQAVVQGIRGASWQLKMRSLAFVCHFDAQYQSRLVDCGLLPLLIAGAAVGERDAMRCAQCLNLMSRMPGQSAALLEHGVLPLVVDLLKSSSTRILSAALAVLASVASLATARRLADAGALVALAAIVRGRRDDSDLPWRTPAVLRAALVTLSSVLHSTGTDVAVAMVGSGMVLFDDATHDDDDNDDDASGTGKQRASAARAVQGRIGVAENDEFESYDSEDDAAVVDAELEKRRRHLRRANCDALVDSGCIDALGCAALEDSVQDAALSLLRDVDSAALVRSDCVGRFLAAVNAERRPLPTRACDVAPPLSSTPILEHEKRVWPTTVTVVEAEPLWHFLLARVPHTVLLDAGFIALVPSYVHRAVRSKAKPLLDAVFAHIPLHVLVEQRLPQQLFLIAAYKASDVAEAVPRASQRSAAVEYIEELVSLENQYMRRSSAVPRAQAAIESDIRAIDRYGGPHTVEHMRTLLACVARLGDAELTEPQYGWGGTWDRAPPQLLLGARASIIDIAIGMLVSHTNVVNELVALFLKLSSETLARHGIVVRLLAIAKNTSVPVAVVSRCLELLGVMSSTYLLERDVLDALFGVIVSRHSRIVTVATLSRFDAQLMPVANDPTVAELTSRDAPFYSDIESAAALMRRRLQSLLAMNRWRQRLVNSNRTATQPASGNTAAGVSYDVWPGGRSSGNKRYAVPRNALAMTIVPSSDATLNWQRVLYSGEPGAVVRFETKAAQQCACGSGKLDRDCCTSVSSQADTASLLGHKAVVDDALATNIDVTEPSPQFAVDTDLLDFVDSDGGLHVLNRTAMLNSWACEVSHVAVLTWDVLRHTAAHVINVPQHYAVVCEAPPLPHGSSLTLAEIASIVNFHILPMLGDLAQMAREYVDSFDYSKMMRVASPSLNGTFSMLEYASSAFIDQARQLWGSFHAFQYTQPNVQYVRNVFLQLSSLAVALLKVARCAVAQLMPGNDDDLVPSALRIVRTKFSADELEQHDALGKLFKHWRGALGMRPPMQMQLLAFVVQMPSTLVWRSSFIVLVCELLKNATDVGLRKSLLTALLSLLRTDTPRAEQLLLAGSEPLSGSMLEARAALFAMVAAGVANVSWSSQGNTDLPIFFDMTQLVSLRNQRAFWLQAPPHALVWPQRPPRALIDSLVDHLVCRSAMATTFDPLMRVTGFVSSLMHVLAPEIRQHIFTTVLAIGVVGSGQATLHNTASTIEWMANHMVQSISPKVPPWLVPGPKRVRTGMSFPVSVATGAAVWFDTPPHWLTHVLIERSVRSMRTEVVAVYQVLHEVPDDAYPPLSADELDALSVLERGARQRVKWSSGVQSLPTAITHTSDGDIGRHRHARVRVGARAERRLVGMRLSAERRESRARAGVRRVHAVAADRSARVRVWRAGRHRRPRSAAHWRCVGAPARAALVLRGQRRFDAGVRHRLVAGARGVASPAAQDGELRELDWRDVHSQLCGDAADEHEHEPPAPHAACDVVRARRSDESARVAAATGGRRHRRCARGRVWKQAF
jgi:hypothetical protein